MPIQRNQPSLSTLSFKQIFRMLVLLLVYTNSKWVYILINVFSYSWHENAYWGRIPIEYLCIVMVTGQPFVKSALKKNLYHLNRPSSIILFYKNTVSFPVSYKKRAQLAQQMYNFFYTDWNIFYFYTSARWHLYDPVCDRRQRTFCSYSQAQWKNMNINNAAIISYYLLKNKWCHIWWKFFFIYICCSSTKLFIVDFCIYLYLNKLLTSSFG